MGLLFENVFGNFEQDTVSNPGAALEEFQFFQRIHGFPPRMVVDVVGTGVPGQDDLLIAEGLGRDQPEAVHVDGIHIEFQVSLDVLPHFSGHHGEVTTSHLVEAVVLVVEAGRHHAVEVGHGVGGPLHEPGLVLEATFFQVHILEAAVPAEALHDIVFAVFQLPVEVPGFVDLIRNITAIGPVEMAVLGLEVTQEFEQGIGKDEVDIRTEDPLGPCPSDPDILGDHLEEGHLFFELECLLDTRRDEDIANAHHIVGTGSRKHFLEQRPVFGRIPFDEYQFHRDLVAPGLFQ